MEQRPSLDDPPTLSSSPDRNRFQHQHYLARQAGKGLTVENDDTTRIMDEFFLSEAEQRRQREAEPGWAENPENTAFTVWLAPSAATPVIV